MTDPNETNEEIYVELSPKDEGKEPLTDDDLEGVNGGVGNRTKWEEEDFGPSGLLGMDEPM